MDKIVVIIINFSFIPTILVSLYAIFIISKISENLKPICGFIIFSSLIDASSNALALFKINNMPLLHIYVAGGFLFLSAFFNKVFEGYINKKIIFYAAITFFIFTIINSVFIQSIYYFNSYALTIESIIIVIYTLSTYTIILNKTVKKNRADSLTSIHWINSGLFLYYASSLTLFYFGKIITSSPRSHHINYTWVLHSVFSILMYCCFFIGLWNRPRNLIS